MRLVEFLAVTGFFVAVNLAAAGVVLFTGQLALLVLPDYRDSVLLWCAVGLLGIGSAMLFARVVIYALRARGRARARA